MNNETRTFNLVLSGGGIKGIAYTGALDVMEAEGIRWGNIAGVSAGAIVGSYAAAGYNAKELRQMLDEFDFSKIEVSKVQKKVPAVSRYLDYRKSYRGQAPNEERVMEMFLNSPLLSNTRETDNSQYEFSGSRGSLFKNIITLSKEGCLCDGDYLEEWVYKSLLKKGIKTFGDLKGGLKDCKNPSGYKIRMTAVDATRAKVVTLPDDISFYGINPDKLEVSRAVRMSTCVPFAFKPVEIRKHEGNKIKTYQLIDGGVLDNFPLWLHDYTDLKNIMGFRLVGDDKSKLLSIDTSLNVLKALISAVHDTGLEKNIPNLKYLGDIYTGNISFLDFCLDEHEKRYLYNAGRNTAVKLLDQFKNIKTYKKKSFFSFLKELGSKL
jgi:NTE family protein